MEEYKSDTISISIFGCCVSRDIFRIAQNNSINIKKFISFISPISLTRTQKYENLFVEEDLIWGTPWYKKNFLHDLNKTAFDELTSTDSDFLIIDFGDIRHSLIYFDNFAITECDSFKHNKDFLICKKFQNINPSLFDPKKMSDEEFSSKIKLYCEALKDKFKPEKIILIEFPYTSKYKSKNNEIMTFENAHKALGVNQLFKKSNHLAEKYLENCIVIKFPDEVLSDENHKWGLNNLHYEQKYYENAFNEIIKIIK